MTTEPQKECPACAGTGKVRDYGIPVVPSAASTFFVIDPLVFDGDCISLLGT